MRYILLLTAFLLAGCSGGSGSGAVSNPLSAAALTPSGLTAAFSQDSVAAASGAFAYHLVLFNHTSRDITYHLASPGGEVISQTSAVIRIYDAAGTAIYGQDATGPITAFDTSFTIASGQSLSNTLNAAGLFPAPGRYTATATFSLQTDPNTGPKSTVVGPLTVTVQ